MFRGILSDGGNGKLIKLRSEEFMETSERIALSNSGDQMAMNKLMEIPK